MNRKLISVVTGILLLVCLLAIPAAASASIAPPVSNTPKIRQVLPARDGSVTAVYSDGTVRSAGNDRLTKAVAGWDDVEQVFYQSDYTWNNGESVDESYLVGLTKNGSVLSTGKGLSHWRDVKELHCLGCGIIGITHDGRLLLDPDWEYEGSRAVLTDLTNVDTLVYSGISNAFAFLKKDGSTEVIDCYGNPYPNEHYENVREVRDSGHAFYVIKNDGTVDGGLEGTYPGLRGAVRIVDYQDWIFGVSSDGKLLTQNGGNIFTNFGSWRVAAHGSPDQNYYGEVDIQQFHQVADIIPFYGLILLNRDGTADTITDYPIWDLSGWNNIRAVYGVSDLDWSTKLLYGIRQDGTVILARNTLTPGEQIVTEQYRGWKLQELYTQVGGVVGLTTDGTLVGDGIYENVDFSVFEPRPQSRSGLLDRLRSLLPEKWIRSPDEWFRLPEHWFQLPQWWPRLTK